MTERPLQWKDLTLTRLRVHENVEMARNMSVIENDVVLMSSQSEPPDLDIDLTSRRELTTWHTFFDG